MSFTSWTALRTAIKDAIADHVAGAACTGSYTIGDRRMEYRSYDELIGLYEKTFVLESMETPGSIATRVSYGRHRRLR